MPVDYLILLSTGLGITWIGLKTREEIYRIAAAVAGAVFLIWGFALAPSPFQILTEAIAVLAVFSICVRCLNE